MMLKVGNVINVLVDIIWLIINVFSLRLDMISFAQNMSTLIVHNVLLEATCSITDAEKLTQTAQSLITNLNVVFNAKMVSK